MLRHQGTQITALGWEPSDPPRRAPEARLRRMQAEFDQLDELEELKGREWIAHTQRMLDAGWPIPVPEQLDCRACLHARTVVAYQRLGPLIPRADAPKQHTTQRPDRDKLEARLARLEELAEQLRQQLRAEDIDP